MSSTGCTILESMKIDFKKELEQLFAPGTKDFVLLEVPCFRYFMIDGEGNPNTAPSYTAALETLYPVSYALKFVCKKELEIDYVVPPLEGLWWADDMDTFGTSRDKSAWKWTMMIMIPDFATEDLIAGAIEKAAKKQPPAIDLLRVETLTEGFCAQIMHIGSYDDEGPTLQRLHREWIPEHDLVENGKHHEIYLSDPRRVAPEKLKTVLRQPVAPK
jgi:hypothetical protein